MTLFLEGAQTHNGELSQIENTGGLSGKYVSRPKTLGKYCDSPRSTSPRVVRRRKQ
jgi:hypothetical protein